MDQEIRSLRQESLLLEEIIITMGAEAKDRLIALRANFDQQQQAPGVNFQLFL